MKSSTISSLLLALGLAASTDVLAWGSDFTKAQIARQEGEYENGERVGSFTCRDEEGKLTRMLHHQDGKIVRIDIYENEKVVEQEFWEGGKPVPTEKVN